MKHSTLLSFNHLSASFDGQTLFSDISGSVTTGARIGLIGPNGAGKSSLLRILDGSLTPDSGEIHRAGRIAFVQQFQESAADTHSPQQQAIADYLPSLLESWWEVLVVLDTLFDWSIDLDQSLHSLSGGEWTKLHTAIAIASQPDLLFLDEPTNHLDIVAVDALTEWLKRSSTPFVTVSHHRAFLDDVCNEIWDLRDQRLTHYSGTLTRYLAHQEDLRAARKRKQSAVRQKIDRLRESEQEMQQQHQRDNARGAKKIRSGDRSIGRAARDAIKKGSAGTVGKLSKQFEERVAALSEEYESLAEFVPKPIHVDLPAHNRHGLVIEVSHGTLSTPNGTSLLTDINLRIEHGERIGIIGANGAGKSLLVRELAHENLHNLRGSVHYGEPYSTMIVDQQYTFLHRSLSLYDNMRMHCPSLTDEQIRLQLARVRFRGEREAARLTSTLSGGEVARLAIAAATASGADLLVLDEPTNNLDYDTVQILSSAIADFSGTLIVISHDLDFLRACNIRQTFRLNNHSLRKTDISAH